MGVEWVSGTKVPDQHLTAAPEMGLGLHAQQLVVSAGKGFGAPCGQAPSLTVLLVNHTAALAIHLCRH